jgi:hypothetical protein
MADPQVPPEIAAALEKGNLIEAIKLLRQQKNLGLAEAKGMVEALQKQAKASGGNVKVNVKAAPTVRMAYKAPAHVGPERRPGLSPGEEPRGGGFPAVVAVIALALVALAVAAYFSYGG